MILGLECRRRHRKCDEVKPKCGSCNNADRECVYTRQLAWGGRSFKKSRFGKCLEAGVKLIREKDGVEDNSEQAASGFIYGAEPLPSKVATEKFPNGRSASGLIVSEGSGKGGTSGNDNTQRKDSAVSILASGAACVPRRPDPLIALPTGLRELWDHALRRSIPLLSTHQRCCDMLCSTLFPMALESPHLQAAIAALAATHRRTAGSSSGSEVPRLRFRSVRLLRDAIQGPLVPADMEKLLATALVLCLADLASSDGEALLFRTHLAGAASMIRSMESLGLSEKNTSTLASLVRLYNSLQTVIHACAFSRYEASPVTYNPDLDRPGVDEMTGFSTALIPIFNGVNQLHTISQGQHDFECKGHYYSPVRYCKSLLEHQSQILLERVGRRMDLRRHCGIMLGSHVPANIMAEIASLDEAWHHAAMIQIWTHGELHGDQLSLHHQVERIITLIQSMNIVPAPCPAIAAVPVLFIAGGVAHAETQRNAIKDLLRQMETCFGMGNVRSTLRYLQAIWNDRKIQEIHGSADALDSKPPPEPSTTEGTLVLRLGKNEHLNAVHQSIHHTVRAT